LLFSFYFFLPYLPRILTNSLELIIPLEDGFILENSWLIIRAFPCNPWLNIRLVGMMCIGLPLCSLWFKTSLSSGYF
jgi:hypothetical protein